MGEGPSVRPYRDHDLTEVLDVLRAALGEPPGLRRTPELFRWKHLDNPFGRSIMLVAWIDGRIAGFRAFMRWQLASPTGEILECGRAVDTSTHPDFQRRGVFRALTEAGIEEARRAGIDLIFNTPNPKSGAGYLTMGWHEVGAVGAMVRPRLRLLSGRDRQWSSIESHGPEPASLTSILARPSIGLRTPRSADYLEWRFSSHPTARYVTAVGPDGAAIGRLSSRYRRRELVLSELGGSGGARAATALMRRYGPDYAVGWFSPGTPERRSASKAGLIPVPKLTAMTLVARPLGEVSIDTAVPENWDLALGDLELL